MKERTETITQQIARQLGGVWKAVRDGWGWMYECDDGRTVRRYAECVLTYDGYSDEKFNTVYMTDDGTRVFVY